MKQRANNKGSASLSRDYGRNEEMPAAQYCEEARSRIVTHAPAYERLTRRERWIVSQLVQHKGAPNKVIAYTLHISPNTLRNHLASIYAKLGVRRRVELVLYALERGLERLPDK